jgi:hypothetical protein
LGEPNSWISALPKPSEFTSVRSCSMLAGSVVRMVITVPPLKSTPTLRPTKMKSSTEASDRRPETKKPKRLQRMIGKRVSSGMKRMGLNFMR